MYVFDYYEKIICSNWTCFSLKLGLNGGVCRATATGGVVCTCPAGYTGVRWYVYRIDFDYFLLKIIMYF
jgi:hypothetical protein